MTNPKTCIVKFVTSSNSPSVYFSESKFIISEAAPSYLYHMIRKEAGWGEKIFQIDKDQWPGFTNRWSFRWEHYGEISLRSSSVLFDQVKWQTAYKFKLTPTMAIGFSILRIASRPCSERRSLVWPWSGSTIGNLELHVVNNFRFSIKCFLEKHE
jgi:hypothetical protein